MPKLSAFADEVTVDLAGQVSFLVSQNVGCLELRFVNGKNVVDLTDGEARAVGQYLNTRGIRVSAIASPVGKVRLDEPYGPHREKFMRAVDRAQQFSAPFIRIFSYYAPSGKDIGNYRAEVVDRMSAKVEMLKGTEIVLVHENETDIYGSTAERCVDLMKAVNSPKLRLAYDPANFVWGQRIANNVDVCWPMMKPYVVHVHLKDWKVGETHVGSMTGKGDGQIPELLADLARMKYNGFLTVEPHLKSGGQFGGETDAESFAEAIRATRGMCAAAGLELS